MEIKKCSICEQTKLVSEFHTKKKTGIDTMCKKCRLNLNRRIARQLDDNNHHIKLNTPMKRDFCIMYEWMKKMGYDPESTKSIHEQFAEKWGVPIKKLDKPWKVHYSYSECKKKPPIN